MKNNGKTKQALAMVLAVSVYTGLLPVPAMAADMERNSDYSDYPDYPTTFEKQENQTEQADKAEEDDVQSEVAELTLSEDDFPSSTNEELEALYVEQLSAQKSESASTEGSSRRRRKRSTHAGDALEGIDRLMYDKLRKKIKEIAEKGGETKIDVTVTVAENDVNKTMKSCLEVVKLLMNDIPVEFYWQDRVNNELLAFASYQKTQQDSVILTISVYIPVAKEYRDETVTGHWDIQSKRIEKQNYTVRPAVEKNVKDANENAARWAVEIKAMQGDDLAKLRAIKDKICENTSYQDHNANDLNPTHKGSGPWQIISALDNDPKTQSVCEAYAKAFQHMCDLVFGEDATNQACYTVTGTMNNGPHMWNIVQLDGQNYLVDVTNSDKGTGENGGHTLGYFINENGIKDNTGNRVAGDGLFMVSMQGQLTKTHTFGESVKMSGDWKTGYTVAIDGIGEGVTYVYDKDTTKLYDESVLDLSSRDVTYWSEGILPTGNQYTDYINKDESKEKRIIHWATGVTPPKMGGEHNQFKRSVTSDSEGKPVNIEYIAPFEEGRGYYDVTKDFNNDANLCFAAAAANSLHWWLDQNKVYIDRYLQNNNEYQNRVRLEKIRNQAVDQTNSIIYKDIFVKQFENRPSGYWAELLQDQFINGFYLKLGTNVNGDAEKQELLSKGPDLERGGFFYDVFQADSLSHRYNYSEGDYEKLNKDLKAFIDDGKLVLMGYTVAGKAHIVTLWGAEYDENDKITAVYYTDSDDGYEGMKRFRVLNKNGKACITTRVDNESSNAIQSLVVLSTGKEGWEKALAAKASGGKGGHNSQSGGKGGHSSQSGGKGGPSSQSGGKGGHSSQGGGKDGHSSQGGGSGSSGTARSDKKTDQNPDRPKTEISKKTDGTKVETVTKPDGTVSRTETTKDGDEITVKTQTDGSTITAVKKTDGTSAAIVAEKTGQTKAEVTLSEKAVSKAKAENKPISLPVMPLEVTKDRSTAPVIKVETENLSKVDVTIPVKNPTSGTVAVLVHADGTEKIVRKAVAGQAGITLSLENNTSVKLVNNVKTFIDTQGHWAEDAINFVTSHELYRGTSENTFSPNASMTRGMLAVVLHNLENNPVTSENIRFKDVQAGTWYVNAVQWAVEADIVSGYENGSFGVNENITREQLVTILYRHAGKPMSSQKQMYFTDTDKVSSYAREAMQWAVKKGIINGTEDGKLDPAKSATRAEVASILMRYMKIA